MPDLSRRTVLTLLGATALVSACGGRRVTRSTRNAPYDPPLFPNETPELRSLINKWSDHYEVPRDLVHAQIVRESTHRPWARNGPYYGLMQILPQTARTMGFRGQPNDLLDASTNLEFAVKYLKGAYMVSGGDKAQAMQWYARGYYYEAKRLGLLKETGLRS